MSGIHQLLTGYVIGTSVTINARHYDATLEMNTQTVESYSVTFPRIRWPQRELTLIEKGLAACECITSMKEEIRLLVGQIDDLECRLDSETSELMEQLQEERSKIFFLESSLLEYSRQGTEQEKILTTMRQTYADELSMKDRKIASLESALQVKMKELTRTVEEQLSAAQLLKIRQSKLADGYEARLVEIQETAQAVRNSIDLTDQSKQKSLRVLDDVSNNLIQLRTKASQQFQVLYELSDGIEKQVPDFPVVMSSITTRACVVDESSDDHLAKMEQSLCYLENDVALMRSIAGCHSEIGRAAGYERGRGIFLPCIFPVTAIPGSDN
jgi:hypothetical protein